MNPESHAAVLDGLRAEDQISSVGYTSGITKIWAMEYDALHLAETGITNSGIVEALLSDRERVAES